MEEHLPLFVHRIDPHGGQEDEPVSPEFWVPDGVVYLGCPYSSDDPALEAARASLATAVAAELTAAGWVVVSPITQGHAMVRIRALPSDYTFWRHHCRTILSVCAMIAYLDLPGADVSTGLRDELQYMRERGRPVARISLPDAHEAGATAVPWTDLRSGALHGA